MTPERIAELRGLLADGVIMGAELRECVDALAKLTSVESELKQRDNELRIRNNDTKNLMEQVERLLVQCHQAELMNLKLAAKLGAMEQQRNHARWKYGRAKRRWRALRQELETRCGQLALKLGIPGVVPGVNAKAVEAAR